MKIKYFELTSDIIDKDLLSEFPVDLSFSLSIGCSLDSYLKLTDFLYRDSNKIKESEVSNGKNEKNA